METVTVTKEREIIPGTTGTKFMVVAEGDKGKVGIRPINEYDWRIRVVPREATEEEMAEGLGELVVNCPNLADWGGTWTPLRALKELEQAGWKTPLDGEKRYSVVCGSVGLHEKLALAATAVGAAEVDMKSPDEWREEYERVTKGEEEKDEAPPLLESEVNDEDDDEDEESVFEEGEGEDDDDDDED